MQVRDTDVKLIKCDSFHVVIDILSIARVNNLGKYVLAI